MGMRRFGYFYLGAVVGVATAEMARWQLIVVPVIILFACGLLAITEDRMEKR